MNISRVNETLLRYIKKKNHKTASLLRLIDEPCTKGQIDRQIEYKIKTDNLISRWNDKIMNS